MFKLKLQHILAAGLPGILFSSILGTYLAITGFAQQDMPNEIIYEPIEESEWESIVVLDKPESPVDEATEPLIEEPDIYSPTLSDVIFVGDSRTVGMGMAVIDNINTIAEVGQGYYWLVNTADEQLRNQITDQSIVVFNLGVNDLANADKYCEYLSTLQQDYPNLQIWYVSINPVEDTTVTNTEINQFNEQIQNAGFNYIDTNSYLTDTGFNTVDGLHYTSETYQKIFDQIIATIF
ncbi:SGNH/GDSL hydrolase family protein [Butyrivibrio sp.]|uniref:SGNH/GDSL hydrolase family protein n=1 Tax=Butyrivibrio sp. TaxID=28121 RepID=UPI0025C10F5F|nr:SGNH/GDSL hydrolase family protein [Butyrivibrio sp.]MBQ9302325.1 hypothetical protein [Butyrivibrio sp.]